MRRQASSFEKERLEGEGGGGVGDGLKSRAHTILIDAINNPVNKLLYKLFFPFFLLKKNKPH